MLCHAGHKQRTYYVHCTLMSLINLFTVGSMRSGTATQIVAMHFATLLKACTNDPSKEHLKEQTQVKINTPVCAQQIQQQR